MYKPKLSEKLQESFGVNYDEKPELENEIIDIIALVLNSYINEDELDDIAIERLMLYAEDLFLSIRFVRDNHTTEKVSYEKWQSLSADLLEKHAAKHQKYYQQILHLIDTVFFIQPWLAALIVELGINHSSNEDEIDYTIRFGENLISELYVGATQG